MWRSGNVFALDAIVGGSIPPILTNIARLEGLSLSLIRTVEQFDSVTSNQFQYLNK